MDESTTVGTAVGTAGLAQETSSETKSIAAMQIERVFFMIFFSKTKTDVFH
jgi:hypothetical protein